MVVIGVDKLDAVFDGHLADQAQHLVLLARGRGHDQRTLGSVEDDVVVLLRLLLRLGGGECGGFVGVVLLSLAHLGSGARHRREGAIGILDEVHPIVVPRTRTPVHFAALAARTQAHRGATAGRQRRSGHGRVAGVAPCARL